MMRKMVMALLAGVALGVMAPQIVATTTAQENTPRNTYEYLDLFGDIFERIRVAYVEEVDEQKLIEAAINGMLASLDPHSAYLPPKNFQDMREQTKGEFGGLGIEVTMENGFVKVVAPIDDTPAANAGIESGDFITHIDGESVLGLTLSDAVDKMRGEIGSEIVITISREGADEPFDVTIVRDIIKIRAVRARVEGNVGILRITTFNEQTYDNLVAGIAEIKEELGEDGIVGYIVDLRNNPGGLLSQAIAVSDAFLEEGEIVSTRGRDLSEAAMDGRRQRISGDRLTTDPVRVDTSQAHEFTWRDELGLSAKEPFVLRVNAVDDEAPVIFCNQLQREQVVLSTDVLQFDVRAEDDFGVERIGLQWSGIEDPLDNPSPVTNHRRASPNG